MELQKKFDKWLEDEKFVTFANKRLKDEILHVPENHLLDPKHEELEEGFENYGVGSSDWYAARLGRWRNYGMQLAKCSRNAKKRKRGIWWVYVQVHILGFYTKVFACEFENLVRMVNEEIMLILHSEYTQSLRTQRQ